MTSANIHHSTVGSLLREQISHRRKERKDTVHSLLDGFDAAIGEAWERLSALPKNSASPAGPPSRGSNFRHAEHQPLQGIAERV